LGLSYKACFAAIESARRFIKGSGKELCLKG